MAMYEITPTYTITLGLSVAEVRYLKGVLQNYLGEYEEPAVHAMHREHLFNALHKINEDIKDKVASK